MSRATKNIGTGLKIITGSKGAPFTLEFLTDTIHYAANTSKIIVVPYIELGRDKSCGVSFGEDSPMVSRKHAALERKNGKVVLLNLSSTNQTLVNGRPVIKEWPLHNGDEIQLSADGPRIRFFNNPGPSPLKFTARMKLFAQQSLRPYRFAIISLLLLFVVFAIAAGFVIKKLVTDKDQLKAATESIEKQIEQQKIALAKGDSARVAQQARHAEQLAAANATNESFQKALTTQGQALEALALSRAKKTSSKRSRSSAPVVPAASPNAPLGNAWNYVYAIQVFLTIEDRNGNPLELNDEKQKPVKMKDYFLGTGTGFVLEDGRFVTSRRWVEPWAYPKGEKDMLNLFANFVRHNGGVAKVRMVATAPNGQDFVFHSHEFTTDPSGDRVVIGNFGFGEGKIAVADQEKGAEWAVRKPLSVVGLPFSLNPEIRNDKPTELHFLGYEIPEGVQAGPAGNPTYAKYNVSINATSKVWPLSKASIDPGSYGGPAMIMKEGKTLVVGLLAGNKEGKASVIPLSSIR